MRAVQLKELKDHLADIQKIGNPSIQLFTPQSAQDQAGLDPALRARLKEREEINDDDFFNEGGYAQQDSAP